MAEKALTLAKVLGSQIKFVLKKPKVVELDIARAEDAAERAVIGEKVSVALAQGASAPDVGRILLALGQDIDPDSATWIKVMPEGFNPHIALASLNAARTGQGRILAMPEFLVAIPSEGVDVLPTLEEAVGPPSPPGPPHPAYREAAQMAVAGATAQDVASFLISNGAIGDPRFPSEQRRFVVSSAQFIRVPHDGNALALAIVSAKPPGAALLRIVDGKAYPGIENLPTPEDIDFPVPDGSGKPGPFTRVVTRKVTRKIT